MRKIYYLSSCNTCNRIIKELGLTTDSIEMQDIKTSVITTEQLDRMKTLSGSYESLFSRRSMKYKAWDLAEKELSEDDYRDYILKEYTFLKRPVIIIDEQIFIGNSKKVIQEAQKNL